jgi:hypothetical protein
LDFTGQRQAFCEDRCGKSQTCRDAERWEQPMTSTTELELLIAFGKRLEAERRRIIDLLMAARGDKALDPEMLRQLSIVQGACLGVAAEIEAHTPTIGGGAET